MTLFRIFQESPIGAIIFVLAILLALTVHEFAHAWVAYKLGDDTPHLQGRVTLNPAAHLDPIGTLAFIFFGFGWGKPVMYNPMRLQRRSDELLIALAGPISNLFLAIGLNILAFASKDFFGTFSYFLGIAAYLNVVLASFNLVPIPPLDGSSIVAYFFPEYRSIMGSQVGFIILLLLIFIPIGSGGSVITTIIQPVIAVFSSLTHLFGVI